MSVERLTKAVEELNRHLEQDKRDPGPDWATEWWRDGPEPEDRDDAPVRQPLTCPRCHWLLTCHCPKD